MPDLVAVRSTEPWRRRLYLPAYRIKEAARYCGESPQTIYNWHHRDTISGLTLPGTAAGKPLSYLQLVEVAVVARFRQLGVPLENIRKARSYLATTLNEEYPFAVYAFKTEGVHLLLDFANVEQDDALRLIVADRYGQLGWAPLLEDRLLEFDYEDNLALKWHVGGRSSLVLIDPRIAFGAPTVQGLPTWVIKGRHIAGESMADIMDDFGVDEAAVKDGLKFEGIELAA